MFEQHKLAHEYGMWGVMGATNLGRSTLVMAHELAHSMGVDHDGEGVNQDCDGGHQDEHDEDHGQTYDEPKS